MAVALLLASCASDGGGEATPAGDGSAVATASASTSCDWAMAGHGLDRLHATGCDGSDAIGIDTLDRLVPVWSLDVGAEVTGAPAITDDAVYFGDWAGVVHAVDRASGEVRWTRETPLEANLYAGQIPASPTIAEIDGTEVLVVASGRTVLALATADGTPVWQTPLGTSDDEDPTEIQGSPAVADGLVLVPTDVHNAKDGRRSGLVALALDDGTQRWTWDPEEGWTQPGAGASGARRRSTSTPGSSSSAPAAASPAVVQPDERGDRRHRPRHRRAALDLPTSHRVLRPGLGLRRRAEPVLDRRSAGGRAREQGRPLLRGRPHRRRAGLGGRGRQAGGRRRRLRVRRLHRRHLGGARRRRPPRGGRRHGGGDCPCEHGFDAATGEAIWQSPEAGGTYGASGAADGVVFTAGIDQTLRAYDLATGEVRWKRSIGSLSASGPAIAGDLLVIGVGFREPGNDAPAAGGVRAFRVLGEGEAPPSTTTTTLPDGPAVTALAASDQACVGAPCDLDFTLKDPPAGHRPTLTLEVTPSPLRIRIEGDDLGDPADWLGDDGPAAADGATAFAVFITPRDDKPELGSIVCILDEGFDCEGDAIVLPADAYTRLSVLALADPDTPPAVEEGYDRLVTTHSFDPGLVPAT
ncbi:MAG: PQQ-binding-like beta-propeller repeat protein [Acidimicrobiales bacterium]